MGKKWECETCEEHEKMVEELKKIKNKLTFWPWLRKWWFLHVVILAFLGGTFAWGRWVTISIYGKDVIEIVAQKTVEKLAEDVKEIKQEIKEQVKKQQEDQKDIYNLLLDIKKEVKKK